MENLTVYCLDLFDEENISIDRSPYPLRCAVQVSSWSYLCPEESLTKEFQPHLWTGSSTVSTTFSITNIPHICHFFYTGKIFGEKNLHQNLHSKLPIYTVNCQIFALNLKKFTPAKKIYMGAARGARVNFFWPVSIFTDLTRKIGNYCVNWQLTV